MEEIHNTTKNSSFINEEIKTDNKKKSKKMKSFKLERKSLVYKIFSPIFTMLFSMVLGLIIGASYVYIMEVRVPTYANHTVLPASTIPALKITNYNELVKMAIQVVEPSVVSITSLEKTDSSFGFSFQTAESASGVIFHETSSEFFIVTNNHVIENASAVGIAFGESEPVSANFVGADSNYDIAVVSVAKSKIDEKYLNDISVARFADTSNVQIGDTTIAIGNAIGEGLTSTFGIISITSKDVITDQNRLINVMQTTSAINPGNSGGALINLNGDIIGINTSKVYAEEVEGVGYAISSSDVMPIVENIMNNTKPASLGVLITNVPQGDSIFGGALIVELVANGSAEKGGLEVGDIITNINNVPILSSSQLVEEIKNYSEGDVVSLNVIRNGELLKMEIKLLPAQNTLTSF